jgi:Exonuclease
MVIASSRLGRLNWSTVPQPARRFTATCARKPADALTHGLSAEFLADKPVFGALVHEFLAFVGHLPLVAHNAGFDITFLNGELASAAKPPIATERVVDTLVLARRKQAARRRAARRVCCGGNDQRHSARINRRACCVRRDGVGLRLAGLRAQAVLQFENDPGPADRARNRHGDAIASMDSPLVALCSGMDVLETHQLQPSQLGHTAWHEIFLFDAIERVPIHVALI